MYEGSLCLCCMSTENLVRLFVPEPEKNGVENYANMLALCLRIPVSETDGHDFICNICVDKLTDCICFKKQALKSISILTSVDLCELLPAEELELLGLSEPEQIIELEVEHHSESEVLSDCDDITEDMSIISTEETKKKVKRKVIVNIPQTLGNATSPKVEGSPASLASPPRVSASPAPSRGRRSVGRPRTRSPALPYPVRRDERSCRECGLTCPTHITLKIHYNTHFGRHVCSFDGCDKRFMTRASLHKHAATHQTGPFRCDQCEQEFSKLNTYLSHKRLKHGASLPYRCGECGLRFRTAARRRTHLAAAHAHTERRYTCRYCDKKFLDSGARAKHVACVHEARRVQCARCGAGVRRAALSAHMRRHDGLLPKRNREKRFVCKLCGAAFAQKHTLQYHVRAHARRGDYAGDVTALVSDTRRPHAHCGLLSDVESETDEQHLDESALSDELPPLDADNTSPVSHASEDKPPTPHESDNELQVPDSSDKQPTPDHTADEQDQPPDTSDYDFLPGGVEALEDDLYTYLDFSALPSDFDD